ncbi:hypothetical protein BKI52_15925 [marine bacterium AO1-C]|nr:hypothetical protein BKI52_15925 [marine bacterium AO1-C]
MYGLQIQKLIIKKDLLDNPADKIKLLQQAIGLADTHQDIEWAINLRLELMEEELDTPQSQLSLEALSWIIGAYEQDSSVVDETSFLWQYKWVLDNVITDPNVSVEQRDAIIADFSMRFQRNHYSLRPLYESYFRFHNYFGIQEKAKEYQALRNQEGNDEMSDCPACELDTTIGYLINFENIDKAKAEAQDILNGKLNCNRIPIRTLARFTTALTKQNRLEEAKSFFEEGMKNLTQKGFRESDFKHTLEFAYYLSKTDNTEAWKLITAHYPKQQSEDFLRYRIAVMMLGILKNTPDGKINVQFPDWLGFFQHTAEYDKATLEKAYYEEAKTIGNKFAARENQEAVALHLDKSLSEM